MIAERRLRRLTLRCELAPLRPARPGGGTGGPARAGGQQLVGDGAGRPARLAAVTHGHRPRPARARSAPGRVQAGPVLDGPADPVGPADHPARRGPCRRPAEPRWSRESLESLRWSPRTKSPPSGTTTSKDTVGRAVTGVQERRLVDRPAVHLDPPLACRSRPRGLPPRPHALDVVGVARSSPVPSNDDDVTALRLGTETVRQLVDENAVPDPQSGLHRAAGNLERLHDERC